MALLVVLSVSLFLAAPVTSYKPPPYLKTCSRNDPNINQCAVKVGREMIPFLIPGDRSIRLPPLDPLLLEKLEVNPAGNSRSAGLKMTCRKCNILGLGQGQLEDIRIDLEKRRFDIDLSIPSLSIIGKYDVTGRILILPIRGNGDANITIPDLSIKLGLRWEVRSRKNTEYAQITTYDVDFQTSRLYIRLDNLFGGDKLLGDNMNNFLNENWEDVLRDFRPAVSETIGETVKLIINNIFENIPYQAVFPE